MNTDDILIESSQKADKVFLNHETISLWDEMITGSCALREDELKKKRKDIVLNTPRALHKIDNNRKIL